MQAQYLPVQKAVRRGQLIATGAVFFIFLGVLASSIFIATLVSAKLWTIFIGLIASFVIGWITWAWIVPVWRLWAMQRISRKEIFALHRLAVNSGLEWPYGHIFSRTEIKSNKQTRREAKFILDFFAGFLQDTIDINYQWDDPIFRAYWRQVILILEEFLKFVTHLKSRIENPDQMSKADASSDRKTLQSHIDLYQELEKEQNNIKMFLYQHFRAGDAISGETQKFFAVSESLGFVLMENLKYCKSCLRSIK